MQAVKRGKSQCTIPIQNIDYCPSRRLRGQKGVNMYDKIEQRIADIYERLDNLEGCEDNPVYADEIKSLRQELAELNEFMAAEFF